MSDDSNDVLQPEPVNAPVAAPEPAAPKKKRTGLVIGLVIGAVVLCGLGACAAIVVGGLSLGALGGDTKLISTAEVHYAGAQSAVETATAAIEGVGTTGTAATDDAIAAATESLRIGRDEIAASRAAIEQLDESQGRTDYLASLDAATVAFDGLEDLLAYLSAANNLTARMEEASTIASDAHDDLNAAIKAGNDEKYSTMKKKATAARDGFEQAAKLFRDAHDLDTSAGLDKAADYADKRAAQAEVVIVMAGYGADGDATAYNESIDRMEKLDAQADEIGEPAIVSDENWVENRLSSLTEAVVAAGAKADELHAKAIAELLGN